MYPACFPKRSLDGCHCVGGLAARHTTGHAGESSHPPSLDTCTNWGLEPLDVPMLSPQESKTSLVPITHPSCSIVPWLAKSPVPPPQHDLGVDTSALRQTGVLS